jgi:hypothetical protein
LGEVHSGRPCGVAVWLVCLLRSGRMARSDAGAGCFSGVWSEGLVSGACMSCSVMSHSRRLCCGCAAHQLDSRVVCGIPGSIVVCGPVTRSSRCYHPLTRMHTLQPTQKPMKSENMAASRVYVGRGCISLLPAASSNALLLLWQRATVFTHTAYTAVTRDHAVPL